MRRPRFRFIDGYTFRSSPSTARLVSTGLIDFVQAVSRVPQKEPGERRSSVTDRVPGSGSTASLLVCIFSPCILPRFAQGSNDRQSSFLHDAGIAILGEKWLDAVWDSLSSGWLVVHAFTGSLSHLALRAFTGLSSDSHLTLALSGAKVSIALVVISDPRPSPRGMAIAVLTFEQSLHSVYRMRVG